MVYTLKVLITPLKGLKYPRLSLFSPLTKLCEIVARYLTVFFMHWQQWVLEIIAFRTSSMFLEGMLLSFVVMFVII